MSHKKQVAISLSIILDRFKSINFIKADNSSFLRNVQMFFLKRVILFEDQKNLHFGIFKRPYLFQITTRDSLALCTCCLFFSMSERGNGIFIL